MRARPSQVNMFHINYEVNNAEITGQLFWTSLIFPPRTSPDGYQKTFYRLPRLFLSQATLGSLRSPISFSPCFTWELFRRLITSASSTYSKMPFIRTLFLSYDTSSVTKRASYTLSCVQRNRQNWILKWKNKTQYLYQWFFGFRVIQFFTGGKYLFGFY